MFLLSDFVFDHSDCNDIYSTDKEDNGLKTYGKKQPWVMLILLFANKLVLVFQEHCEQHRQRQMHFIVFIIDFFRTEKKKLLLKKTKKPSLPMAAKSKAEVD